MQEIFGDIPRRLNKRGDLLLRASCWEEHNETWEAVLRRPSVLGITFNCKKYMFGKSELEFYGHKTIQILDYQIRIEADRKESECCQTFCTAPIQDRSAKFLGHDGLLITIYFMIVTW